MDGIAAIGHYYNSDRIRIGEVLWNWLRCKIHPCILQIYSSTNQERNGI